VIFGLYFEFLAVLYQARKVLKTVGKSEKEKKENQYDQLTIQQHIIENIKEKQKSHLVTITLLFIGLLLQAMAIIIL